MKKKAPTTTTALAIPTSSFQPKPTKTEIIEALLVRAKVAHDLENDRRDRVFKATRKKIDALAIKASRGITPVVEVYSLGCPDRAHCDVKLQNIRTDEMLPLFELLRANDRLRWYEKEAREKIRLQLSGMTKPSPTRLLDNPDAVVAMDAMLKAWSD